MEITEGHVGKFDIAKLILKPPLREDSIIDVEILFASKVIPGLIKGYVTMRKNGNYDPRTYSSGEGNATLTMSRSAKRKFRMGMKQLVTQLIGELEDA
jgi:hypothetical protein